MSKEIKYTIVDDFDHIFDEKGSTFLSLRKIYWGSVDDPEKIDKSKIKLDMRRWHTNADGEENVGKGLSFLTDQGANNLTRILVENNYGKTKEILHAMKDRDDFRISLNSVLGKDDEHYDDTIKEEDLYIPGDSLFDYEE